MVMHHDNRNVFQIYKLLNRVPFAVSRKNWSDHDLAVVTKVIPKGDYGIAYGFPVRNGVPNDHFAYDNKWKKEMEMPNAGSYQWRIIDIPDFRLEELIREFYAIFGKQFGFMSAEEEKQREKEYLESLIRLESD